jgi:hypothetical protein
VRGAVRKPQGDLRARLAANQDWKRMSDSVDVMNVPDNMCTEQALRGYYAKFGSVVRIDIDAEVQRDCRNAKIVFMNHEQARAAVGDKEVGYKENILRT